jgi:hypothetical protein
MGDRAKDGLALLLLVAATAALRATSFVPAVVDTDEGLYMVQAAAWLEGGWPLVAVWDMHPVGAPALFALAFLAFGVGVEAVRLLGLFCVAATACGLFALVRGAGGPRSAGMAAGLTYGAYSLALSGLCVNTELLIAPFVTGAMAIGVRGFVRARAGLAPGWAEILGMGALIGPALLVKQVVVPEGSLAFALLVGPAWMAGLLPWRRVLAMAAAYAALCAGPFLLMGLVYAAQGWLPQYLDGSLLAPFRYSMERAPPAEAWRRIWSGLLQIGLPVGAALVALSLTRRRPTAQDRLGGLGALWLAVATLGVAAPGFYFAHYFLLLLPPLSVLAALGLVRLAQAAMLADWQRRGVALLLAGLLAVPWLSEMHRRVEIGPGWLHPDPVRQVAAAMEQAAGRGASAFIANYHVTPYMLSGTRPVTRYVLPVHLTGGFEDLSDTSADAELARVLAARPSVIVIDRGWMHTMRPPAAAAVLAAIDQAYELAASVAEQRGPVEIWRLALDQGAGNSAFMRPSSP